MSNQIRYANDDQTDAMIAGQLTENTGTSILDSGGAYGRHWQRNAGKTADDFRAQDRVSLTFEQWEGRDGEAIWEINSTVSLFHFLSDNLNGLTSFNRMFRAFADAPEREYDSWFEIRDAFLCELVERGWTVEWEGGDPIRGNTYNDGDNRLSQDFEYVLADITSPSGRFQTCVAGIMTHNGCDARGGYSTPVWYEVKSGYGYDLLRYKDICIGCDGRPDSEEIPGQLSLIEVTPEAKKYHHWDTLYDGYNFYNDEEGTYLTKFGQEDFTNTDFGLPETGSYKGPGKCPVCKGNLTAYPMWE